MSLNCPCQLAYGSSPQVLYEHGEPWWNYINRGELLIHPLELSGNRTSSHLVAKHEGLMKEMMNNTLQSISYFKGFFNMP
jgi:hypothetical protein